jgi:23S rRNA pseudouridine955/2504/2580 synthase/23S rRNA pseudouridine1911/1915/1917 synthase
MQSKLSFLKFTYLGPKESLIRVLKSNHLKDFSLKSIKRAIDHKAARIDGRLELFSNTIISSKNVIEFDLSRLELPHLEIEKLYEDDDILVINKPSFFTSSEDELNKALKVKYYLCHRIDKETSGVLILAKNKETLQYFETAFEKKLILKRYLALVYTDKKLQPTWSVKASLKVARKTEYQVKMQVHPSGQLALTQFKLNRANEPFYLLECYPKTGRTHQIRVHLSSIGAPIVGDLLYHGIPSKSGRFMLHAESIQFKHPKKDETVTVSAPLPLDFLSEVKKRLQVA